MDAFVEYMSKVIRFINVPGVKIAICIGIAVVVGTYVTMVGKKETWSRLKQNKAKIITACLAAAILFTAVFLPAGLRIPEAGDCEAITPNDWKEKISSYDDREVYLDFAEKERISLGLLGFHGKYGFRKELVVEKPIAFSMGIPPDYHTENLRFGLYRDKDLTDPIDEADAGYNLKADVKLEEGAEYSDYPDFKIGIFSILEPGTYYAAVYSVSPFDKVNATYVSWFDVLDDDLTLEAGKSQYFYAIPGQTYEFPFTVADDEKIILETSGIAGTLTLYDKDRETVLDIQKIKIEKKSADRKISFQFDEDGTYYFKLTDYPEEKFKKLNLGRGILYPNWLRYKVVK